MNRQHAESVALCALLDEFRPGGAEAVLQTYLKLHEGKIGAHWLWCAIERIAAGRESEADVLADFGYAALSPHATTEQSEAGDHFVDADRLVPPAAPAPCAGNKLPEVGK